MLEALTVPERRLRALLVVHAVWSALLAGGYLVTHETGVLAALPNSFAKDVLLVVISALAAADVRRRGWLTLVLVAAYLALVVGQIATLAWGGAPDVAALGLTIPAAAALLGWMAIDLVLAALLFAWWVAAARAADGLRFLHPVAHAGLVALAEVLVEGRREALDARAVARNVDDYLATLRARGKGRVQLALVAITLWPLATLRPPLPALAPESRKRFLERRFVDDIGARRVWRPVRPVLQTLIRTAAQMAYLGYYGDRRSWRAIRYVPYRDREGGRAPQASDHAEPPLKTLGVPPRDTRYDTVVVGSGAAGAILAHRFAETGRRVLVVERGPHADPRAFGDDEVAQYLRLYNEGALQLATDFSLQVLQGMCVGGGTTINNGLCLDPPAAVLDAWAAHGVDPDGLRGGIETVRRWLGVAPIAMSATTVAAQRFARAAAELELPGRLEVMSANITGACRGCGYCNIGCAYGARRAALDWILPRAQQRFGLDVLPDVEVERILTHGDRAVGVLGRSASGEAVSIAADEVVLAAGPIASSWILQRSGLGGDAVGRNLHFNVVSPITAEFPDAVDSFAGIQMSHAYVEGEGIPAYLLETWFNPPATQALAMPGWFDAHFEHMTRYRRMAAAGALVGTTTPGRVRPTRAGPAIDFTPSRADRDRVVAGLETAGRIWLRAGATRVMPATFAFRQYASAQALERLPDAIRETGDLPLSSAHPQGGNAMGAVVDEAFRVRGLRNLRLCDASVFPSSVHVNPQLTVMGLAQHAAERILGAELPAATVAPVVASAAGPSPSR